MAFYEKTELRVLLVALQPQKALALLDRPGLCVCGVAGNTQEALRMLPSLQPHAVVFFDAVPLLSKVLQSISDLLPVAPPRIICPRETPCAVDAVFDPSDPTSLCNAVFSALETPMGCLSAPSFDKRLSLARSLLDSLGMPETLKGKMCIACGAAWLSAFPYPAPPVQHLLYPQLAKACGVTPAAIERRIRSAVESTWLHGDLQSQSELFGLTVSAERGKPTNTEFLFLLSEHVRRLMH